MADQKKPKGEVHYRNGWGSNYCAVCTMYVKPNQCTAVDGYIAPYAYCDLFEKENSKSEISSG